VIPQQQQEPTNKENGHVHPVMYANIRLEGWMTSEFVDIILVFRTKVNCLAFLK
jgi:hypothetical protein